MLKRDKGNGEAVHDNGLQMINLSHKKYNCYVTPILLCLYIIEALIPSPSRDILSLRTPKNNTLLLEGEGCVLLI